MTLVLTVMLALTGVVPRLAGAQTVLIASNAVWRYVDDGSDQGTAWRAVDFDDTAWRFGPAELGYGDAIAPENRPEATVIGYGPDPSAKFITTYFRHAFTLSDPGAVTNLLVRLIRDDGGLVYLNGVEVFRSGMPTGAVDYLSLATEPGTSGVDEFTFFATNADPTLLVAGTNVVAVEIHQYRSTSSDLSFALELLTEATFPPPPDASLVRGPYLQIGTISNIIVRWRTDLPSDSRVRFGLNADTLDWLVPDPALVTDHLVTLTNLSSDTRYFYSIGTGAGMLAGGPDYSFVTSPIAGKPTRIWAMGDCGTVAYGGQEIQMRDAYYAYAGLRDTDVWLFLGDNAYGYGTDLEYQVAVFDVFRAMLRRTPAWSTLGNHETYSPLAPDPEPIAYFPIFSLPTGGEAGGVASGTENYYSFNYGNIHFVCLDSELSVRQPGSPMLTWLEADLVANTNDWVIAFWHSPPYSKGSHNSDNLFDNGGNMTEMRSYVVPLLESYGVDLVLCGHSHNYERSFLMDGHYGFSDSLMPGMLKDGGSGRPEETGAYRKPTTGPGANEGAVYVVAGSSGWATFQTGRHPAMFASILKVGSLVIDVNGHRLDAQFLRETGEIDDHFTIIKGAPAEPLRFVMFQLKDGEVTAHWKSVAGDVYRIQRTDNLENPQWVDQTDDIVASGATTFWSDLTSASWEKSFFRVVRVGP